jgi:ribonucleotide monophosphatase NagD (HAD superfamily)
MKRIAGLRDIADQFDLYLVDQYGVLHDGVAAYPGAIDAMARLASGGRRVVVLTNSGKGASDNAARLASLGFSGANIHAVVSSG